MIYLTVGFLRDTGRRILSNGLCGFVKGQKYHDMSLIFRRNIDYWAVPTRYMGWKYQPSDFLNF